MARGFVYVLINPAMPGLLKIGRTAGTSEDRAAELSAVTGLPTPFVVACEWYTSDCDTAEAQVHKRLDAQRYSNDREFFRLPLKDAIRIISGICAEFESRPDDLETTARSYRPNLEFFSVSFQCEKCRQKYAVRVGQHQDVFCPNCNSPQKEWFLVG